MKDFKQIDKCDVWPHLQAGKKVFAVILKSIKFTTGLKYLYVRWDVGDINKILKEDNVVFYEEKEEK